MAFCAKLTIYFVLTKGSSNENRLLYERKRGMFFPIFINVLPFFILIGALFWLWMLYDCFVHEKPTERMILWFLIILFTNILGALLYYFVRHHQRLETLEP